MTRARALSRTSAVVSLTLAATCVLAGTATAAAPTSLVGTADAGPQVTIDVRYQVKDNKPAKISGFVALAGGATGPVVEVVPPGPAQDYWCLSAPRTDTDTPGSTVNVYFRDTGDGVTSFDQFTFTSGLNIDCRVPPSEFATARSGDVAVS